MLLNCFTAYIQFERGEGGTLKELGLIELREVGYDVEAVPTDRLQALFAGPVDLAFIYPMLIELVLSFRDSGLFINQRHVEWGLRQAGMTPDGLELLEAMLNGVAHR